MDAQKSCPTCQAAVEPDAIFCLTCGANVEDSLFDTTGDFSEDAELVEAESSQAVTVQTPVPAALSAPVLEVEEKKPEEKAAAAANLRRATVSRSPEHEIKVTQSSRPKWLPFALGGGVLVLLLVVGKAYFNGGNKKAEVKAVVVEDVGSKSADGGGRAGVPTWAGNPKGKLSPEEAMGKIRDLMHGGKAPGGGATSLDFYRQLENAKGGDVLDQVDTIMAASSSDGSKEWAAVECTLDDGDDPELTARCQLAALNKGKAGKQVVDELVGDARKKPSSAALQSAVREAKASINPGDVTALLAKDHVPIHAGIYSAALQNAGYGAAAIKKIEPLSGTDPRAARAAITLLSRGGKCGESEKHVRELTRMAGVASVLPQIRFRALCLQDPDNGAALAEVSVDLPNLSKSDRANLYTVLAATALLAGDVPRAQQACDMAENFSPSSPAVAEMSARCSLASGTLAQRAVKVTRATPTAHVLVTARELVRGNKPKALPGKVPAWHVGGAMERVVMALQRGKAPLVALDEAREALLLGRWDGNEEFPFSQAELLRIAETAPPRYRVFAESVAMLLALHPREAKSRIGFGKTPEANAVRAVIAFTLGEPIPRDATLKTKSKLQRAVLLLHSKDKKALLGLQKDPEVAPKAYAEWVKLTKGADKWQKVARRLNDHPDVLAGDLALTTPK